jgi:uncharacterized membrane protein YhfC
MLIVTYALNALLMIAMPLALGAWLARRPGLTWRLFVIGGVTFVLSQVVHIPLNFGITLAFRQNLLPSPPAAYHLLFNAVILGATAAFCEEPARYLVLKYSLRDVRGWAKALMFGAGHGGFEAILFGIFAGVSYVNLILIRQNPALLNTLPADQLALAQSQVENYWSAPWYISLMGAVERAFALCLHLSLSVLVMMTFLRGQRRWLWLAIGWHWLVNGIAVYALPTLGVLKTEAIIGVMALIGLGIIFALRRFEVTPPPAPPLPEPAPAAEPVSFTPLPITRDMLDRSRFEPPGETGL